MATGAVIGVDVGGTAIKARLVGADGTSSIVQSVPTPQADVDGTATADAVARIVAAAGEVDAVGLTTPGIVDDAAGVCRISINLGWTDVPIRDLVAERTGRPVLLTHDVRAAARGEWAARGVPGGLLLAALGTGLAVAQVDARGVPVGTAWAGEVGQLRWTAGPHAGLRVEEVVSAGGLAKRAGAPNALAVLDRVRAGDREASALWRETTDALAEVLAWSIALTAPATVVLGGGLAGAGEALLAPVRAALADHLQGFPDPVLEVGRLGVDAAAIGVADLARSALG